MIPIVLFLISFLLGIKHSLDVDHVIAISSFMVRSSSTLRTVKMATLWGLGHSITAGIITIILFLVRDIFLSEYLVGFEIVISIMLIFIGIITILWESKVINFKNLPHTHLHLFKKHNHNHNSDIDIVNEEEPIESKKSKSSSFLGLRINLFTIVIIGVLQGLASNEELLLLLAVTLGMNDLVAVIIGIILFSSGVIIGMIVFSVLLNLPSRYNMKKFIRILNIVVASIAIFYGFYLLFGGEGINLIPFLNV